VLVVAARQAPSLDSAMLVAHPSNASIAAKSVSSSVGDARRKPLLLTAVARMLGRGA
jgi:hypothetical protein